MGFKVNSVTGGFREKYKAKLETVKGSLVVLRKLIHDEGKREKPVLEFGEADENSYLSTDFEFLYQSVLGFINKEEASKGDSKYRRMLDRVDLRLDEVTSQARLESLLREEKKAKQCVVVHPSYYPKIYHLPFYISEMRVG